MMEDINGEKEIEGKTPRNKSMNQSFLLILSATVLNLIRNFFQSSLLRL